MPGFEGLVGGFGGGAVVVRVGRGWGAHVAGAAGFEAEGECRSQFDGYERSMSFGAPS